MTTQTSIAAIKARLLAPITAEEIALLRADSRVGVQKLLAQYEKRVAKLAIQKEAFRKRRQLEEQLWPEYPLIAGIDEVGRGPLAGPVVTAAVILPHNFNLWQVNDSKQLSSKLKQELYRGIMEQAIGVSIGIADAPRIDRENIYHATELAMGEAVNALSPQPDYLLVDAMTVPTDKPQEKLIKGDARSISIAAASIVAKVIRDQLMINYAQQYPGYDFANNMGYGTAKHLTGLAKLGVTPLHRRSFAPVQKTL
ncbi:ribonuclease HII [Latilactobacillus graminis]|uniref:Ribonuclease HII n=2 Tax=Latilactobacillus graminis TaxID=60519 RepID=A0AA89L4M1_9LACO|nr:ribonuclease HII [Latilactobacillus graminis]KRM21964.1 ribonuclease HII family protein [Latilactobacillus graminis DSM 20719]QFP79652.1 ribonuclease HII [Latilactobacillus graminis]